MVMIINKDLLKMLTNRIKKRILKKGENDVSI